MAATADRELEQQLMEAGLKLAEPPASLEELLPILDQVENCLSKVEQSPSGNMQSALYPSLKALVTNQLFHHPDVDVKVAVASCISEITRITAPDAPYEDDKMKEVFQLIVSSFENLSDKSSRSFTKRTSILETVAKVRSCVVMLDLECDALIVEMFQHFLNSIRDDHPNNVFSCMETIMKLVVDESEDISMELLSPILACVKKDNEEVLPIARKLAERVLETSAAKLKPYLSQAVESSGLSFDDYSDIVANICQVPSGTVEQMDPPVSEPKADEHESKSAEPVVEETAQVDQQNANEAASAEQVDPAGDKSPKSVVSNGVAQTEENETLADSDTLKKKDSNNNVVPSEPVDTSNDAQCDSMDIDKTNNAEQKPEQTNKKTGKKIASSKKSGEASDDRHNDLENEAETSVDAKANKKEVPSSPHEDPSTEAAVSSENGKETGNQNSSAKVEGESTGVTSPTDGSVPSEGRPQRAGRQKKKDSVVKETTPLADDVSKKVSGVTSDSEAKPHKQSEKKVPPASPSEDVATAKKETGTTSDSEAKIQKQSAKKVESSNNNGDGSSVKQPDEKIKRERASSGKDHAKSSAKDEKETGPSPKTGGKSNKDDPQAEDTPKTNSKRKRTPVKEKPSKTEDFGEILVGSKVKVWWPKDQQFYDGVIDSFDPIKKKHRVLYTDGDEEILNLKRERWELIGNGSESDDEEQTDIGSPDVSDVPTKKRSKLNSDQSTKQGKVEPAAKKGGGASSSKTKASSQKSGRKTKEETKVDTKSKDSSKSATKSENENASKTKDQTSKTGGKSSDVPSKSGSKSAKESAATASKTSSKSSKQETPKSGKSKPETPKTPIGTKGKTPKTAGKSNVNGKEKAKSTSSKSKENEEPKEEAADSAEMPESSPPSATVTKAQGSGSKTGKKRRRF